MWCLGFSLGVVHLLWVSSGMLQPSGTASFLVVPTFSLLLSLQQWTEMGTEYIYFKIYTHIHENLRSNIPHVTALPGQHTRTRGCTIVNFFSSVAHVWVRGAKSTGPIANKFRFFLNLIFLTPIGRRPIRASVATVSFKLVRTHISIGWLFLLNTWIPQKSHNCLLFSAVVFLPLYIDSYHNDVGGGAHFM
jgi:hypothetical protein